MKQRAYDRIAAALSIVLLVGLALTSYYLSVLAERQSPRVQRPLTHEPDYFVERFAVTEMNARGQPSFRLEAEGMQHFPDDDSIEFQQPRMFSLDPERPRLTVRAERGRSIENGDVTHLYGDVVMRRTPLDGSPPMVVHTDYALVLPDEEIVRTDRPVKITQGGSVLTGEGMVFDNAERRLQVDSRVRGVWTGPVSGRPSASYKPNP